MFRDSGKEAKHKHTQHSDSSTLTVAPCNGERWHRTLTAAPCRATCAAATSNQTPKCKQRSNSTLQRHRQPSPRAQTAFWQQHRAGAPRNGTSNQVPKRKQHSNRSIWKRHAAAATNQVPKHKQHRIAAPARPATELENANMHFLNPLSKNPNRAFIWKKKSCLIAACQRNLEVPHPSHAM